MLTVGDKFPAFKLQAAVGLEKGKEFQEITDQSHPGKWKVVFFWPMDFTFVCPTEVLAFHEAAPEFAKMNCQVFGVSVDSHFVHKAWVDTKKEEGGLGGKLNYPLLADLNKQAARDYDVLIDEAGVALRGLFIIDPEGIVRQATINHLPVGRSVKETMRLLKGFQFVAKHGDQVCPADWEEGKETMAANPKGMRDYLKKH